MRISLSILRVRKTPFEQRTRGGTAHFDENPPIPCPEGFDDVNVKDYFTFMSGTDALYELAEVQAGYFTTRQAEGRSVSRQLLLHHLQAGSIRRVAHGVYRLTNFPHRPFEDVMAAVLWAGDAVASHETALAIYELGDAMPANIHLTLPHRFRGKRPGVTIHTSPLNADERSKRNDIPVTTVERTLADVVATSDPSLARTALRDALDRGATTQRRLLRYIAKHPETTVALAQFTVVTP